MEIHFWLSLSQIEGQRLDEALAIAKEFSEAEKMFKRSMKSRLELLVEKKESECAEGCEGRWLRCTLEIVVITSLWTKPPGCCLLL